MSGERVHTHYDNLKVTRNAPIGVIKGAFRAMAQQYHPDKNSSKDAERVMKLINEAMFILGDPLKRAEHDAWIKKEEDLIRTKSDADRATSQQQYRQRSEDTNRTQQGHAESSAATQETANKSNRPPSAVDKLESDRRIKFIVLFLVLILFVGYFLSYPQHENKVNASVPSYSKNMEQFAEVQSTPEPLDDPPEAQEETLIENNSIISVQPIISGNQHFENGYNKLAHASNEQEFSVAAESLHKALDAGIKLAAYELGFMHENSLIPGASLDQAMQFYLIALSGGSANSAYRLGILYSDPFRRHYDKNQAMYYFKQAEKLGHTDAQNRLSSIK